MKTGMFTKSLVFVLLFALSGCGRAEVSDVRNDYILAKDHGWIELAVKIPAKALEQRIKGENCMLEASLNGESFIQETLFLQGGDAPTINTGFLFAAPAVPTEVTLRYSKCLKADQQISASVVLPKDQLLKLEFDGQKITVAAPVAYQPANLSSLDERLVQMGASQRQGQEESSANFSTLVKLVLAVAVLAGFALLVGVLNWFKKPKA